MLRIFCGFIFLIFTSQAFASPYISVLGKKFPNSADEGQDPVVLSSLSVDDINDLGGFKELLPYVTPSPDQDDAGSCLYMSLTGIAEWWLMRLNNNTKFAQDGSYDLSERWWMNMDNDEDNGVPEEKNWRSDKIYLFNHHDAALNRDYRYTKGWYNEDADGNLKQAPPRSAGSSYDTSYNWINDSEKVDKANLIKLPSFDRIVLFADPEENQWNIGTAPDDIVNKIKDALVTNKAPVQVIYNHSGYWHSVYILGFDDNASSNKCSFVEQNRRYFKSKPKALREKLKNETDPKQQESLRKQIEKLETANTKLEASWAKQGGCHPKGMFYVRDSIYSDPSEENYHYDLSNPKADRPYSKRVMLREYDWVLNLANHVNQILAK